MHKCLLLACVVLAACASPGPSIPPHIPPLINLPAGAEDQAEQPPTAEEIFTLTEPVKLFLDRFVSPVRNRGQQLLNLENAVHHPGSLGIRYDPTATLTVAETFRLQRGNCLSLSLMFAAMARELGLPARFQEVVIEPHWNLDDGIVFSTRHINIVSRISRDKYVLDFYRAEPGRKLRPMRSLTDDEAFGQFYNNRGASALAAGDMFTAWLYFREAVGKASEIGYFWSNLGVLFTRNDQPQVAERFFRYAISLHPDDTASYVNLANLLERRGANQEALTLRDEVESLRSSNPYYWFARAEAALDASDMLGALDYIDEAIKRGPEESVFFEVAIHIAQQLERDKLEQRYRRDLARLNKT